MQIMETGLLKCDVDLTTVQSYFVFCYNLYLLPLKHVIPVTALFNSYIQDESRSAKQALRTPKTCQLFRILRQSL